MKKFKGTKGKWSIKNNSDYPLHEIWNDEEFPTLIARTCYAPLSEPNARLIASAPKLLQALEAMIDLYESTCAALPTLSQEKAYIEAKKVIEKAL